MIDPLKVNGSGCIDNTAREAIKSVDKEQEQHDELLKHIFYIVNQAGFRVQGRIVLENKRSGRVWK